MNTERLTLAAIILGIPAGIWMPEIMLQLQFVGQMFLALLKMLIIPLVFASVFVAILSLGSGEALKKLGIKAFAYYFATTALAVFLGLVMVNLFNPATHLDAAAAQVAIEHKEVSLATLLLSFIPGNLFAALAEARIVQILVFVVFFAVAALLLPDQERDILKRFFEAINAAMTKIAGWIIALTPVGVFSLLGYTVAKEGIDAIIELKGYVLTVLAALTVHAAVTLPLVASAIGRFNPLAYFLQVREAVMIAFSTASSSATLPVSIRVSEARGGVDKRSAGFILPLGATVNMDGTALYESIAVLFIANSYGADLTLAQQITIFLTATFASVGAAGIPGAGLVMMTIILESVGLPLEAIGLIVAVDRILDMFRTATNVWGDLLGAKVLNRFVRPD